MGMSEVKFLILRLLQNSFIYFMRDIISLKYSSINSIGGLIKLFILIN